MELTNYDNSLPLNNTDRRHMVIFSPFTKIEQLNAELEQYGGAAAYFTELTNLLQLEYRALRRFFLDYRIDPGFEANGRAPMTDEKHKMIAFGVSEDQQLVEECIETGGIGIGKDVLVSSYLRTSLVLADSDTVISKHHFSRIMQNLGWSKVTKRVKWNGKTEIVWFCGKNDVWNLQMKQVLDETLPVGYLNLEKGSDFDRFM